MNKFSYMNFDTWCVQLIIIHVHSENKDGLLYDAALPAKKPH